jgi:hypothetical protein
MEDDREYYLRRAAEERQAAERAASAEAKRSHHALAEHYAERVARDGLSVEHAAEPTC